MKFAVVIKNHKSKFPNPLILSEGDIVKTGKEDDEFPGWILCSTDDNAGWIPLTILELKNNSATLIKNYNATELNVASEQILKVFHENTNWVWCEANNNLQGWVPVNKIKYLDD